MLIFVKFCLIIAYLLLSFFFSFSAQALSCHHYRGNEICILRIKRSAKYHWEYRASVKVNGVTYPLEVYNCRSKIKTQPNGETVPFQAQGAGEFICQTVNR